MEFTKDVVIDGGYHDWQTKRISFVLERYGADFFKGKKVLELACYKGGLSQMLYNLGANLTAVEGLKENYVFCKNAYPHINFIHKDLDVDEWDFDPHYDIIIHWGLLYHMRFPEISLQNCFAHCDYLFLESLVVDKDIVEIKAVHEENIWGTDQSIHSIGTRFTSKYVESLFNQLSFNRYDDPKLNSNYQPRYDQPEGNTEAIIRRFWVINCNNPNLDYSHKGVTGLN